MLAPEGQPEVGEDNESPFGVPGTIFAACYGTGVPHSWPGIDPEDDPSPDQDYYSMFVLRAETMGWLDSDGHPGLWGMNDAGGDRPQGTESPCAFSAWFQVETNMVPPSRPLPVQPFLRCAIDVCNQFDTIALNSVLLLLPVQRLGLRRLGSLSSMRTARWFGDLDPGRRTRAEIGIAVGQSAPDGALDAAVSDFMRLRQTVLANPSPTPGGLGIDPPFDDSFWGGPPSATAAMRGDLAEWSPETIGWIAQVLAECAAARGLTSPMLLAVSRPE